MSEIEIGMWASELWDTLNFVAYRGPAYLRISVHNKITASQIGEVRKQLSERFSQDEASLIESTFNKVYNDFLKQKEAKNNYSLASNMPGVKERVEHPVTKAIDSLFNHIINLNDVHKWTREQIADWIETLDIDTRFEVKQDEFIKFTP